MGTIAFGAVFPPTCWPYFTPKVEIWEILVNTVFFHRRERRVRRERHSRFSLCSLRSRR